MKVETLYSILLCYNEKSLYHSNKNEHFLSKILYHEFLLQKFINVYKISLNMTAIILVLL